MLRVSPLHLLRRLALDFGYLLVGLPLGIAAFTWEVTGWAVSIGTLIVWIGIPIAVLTIAGSRGLAMLERHRAALVYGAALPARYRPFEGSLWERMKALLADTQTWRDVGWNVISLPIGIVQFTIAMLPLSGLVGLAMPLLYRQSSDDGFSVLSTTIDASDVSYFGFTVDSQGLAWLSVAVGIAIIAISLPLIRGVTAGTAAMSRWILSPSREEELEQRVEQLYETRAGIVDTAASDLARIERDLHDGAQARLVALALDIGIAEDKLASGDHDEALKLMAEARAEAKRANDELRHLARGIRPPLLADRGLEAAVRELAQRNPLATTVSIDVAERPPVNVETAAYFVVSEALTNATKHSGAASATVRVTRIDNRIEIEVRDTGTGGADPDGAGLAGLRRRVEALDGTLTITSPADGGTILRAEMPCGS
ncbi:MAG TPA: sensor domain-containing protein [Baekduia sp.]|nr:sensor domain-containing protein [Baekduia sp.]